LGAKNYSVKNGASKRGGRGRGKGRGRGGEGEGRKEFPFFPSPTPFSFFGLSPHFPRRQTLKIPFLGLSLLPNLTEMLAAQARKMLHT